MSVTENFTVRRFSTIQIKKRYVAENTTINVYIVLPCFTTFTL